MALMTSPSQGPSTYPSSLVAAPTGQSLSSHFAEEETEAQRSEAIRPRPRGQPAAELGLKPESGALLACSTGGRLCLHSSGGAALSSDPWCGAHRLHGLRRSSPGSVCPPPEAERVGGCLTWEGSVAACMTGALPPLP